MVERNQGAMLKQWQEYVNFSVQIFQFGVGYKDKNVETQFLCLSEKIEIGQACILPQN